jgi:very-short-patch-repair endonuclease
MVKQSTARARTLRANSTDAERALWRMLRARFVEGHKFRRQYRVRPYIVDFICLERRLIVEVDGAHHAERAGYDAQRDRMLHAEGFRVLRFSNRDVLTRAEDVVEVIRQTLTLPPP